MKILIVDDEPRIVELFSRLACEQGYKDIDTASSTPNQQSKTTA